MAKRQFVWISVVGPNHMNEFKKALAYHYDKELEICIAKDEGFQKPYAYTDIATGCSFGTRFATIKEAHKFREVQHDLFNDWMKKIIHLRRMSSSYHELKVCKQIYMNLWRVEDEL